MKREYTREEFEQVCDYLLEHVPDITIATDIICGFPGETESEWRETMSLIEKYKFPEVHISQFYARPNTPAFRMKRVNTLTVKNRSRELTKLTESYFPWTKLEGQKMKVWITDIAAGVLAGRTHEELLANFITGRRRKRGKVHGHKRARQSSIVQSMEL